MKAKNRFCLMFRIVARLNRRAWGAELARAGDRPGREPHPYDVLPGGIRGGEEEGIDRPEAVLEFDGADRLSIRNGQLPGVHRAAPALTIDCRRSNSSRLRCRPF